MKILVLNGPNLNLLGVRQPEIYGTRTAADVMADLATEFPTVDFDYFQSNCEGAIIDRIHATAYSTDPALQAHAIVLNAGAYTHTSLAIADAIASVPVPVVEVHISNVHARENIRRTSRIAPVCRGSISGFGTDVYSLAVTAIIKAGI